MNAYHQLNFLLGKIRNCESHGRKCLTEKLELFPENLEKLLEAGYDIKVVFEPYPIDSYQEINWENAHIQNQGKLTIVDNCKYGYCPFIALRTYLKSSAK